MSAGQCAVRCCRAEELGPFCWSLLAAGIAVFGVPHGFAEHTSQMYWFQWDSESCSRSDQQTATMTFWGASLGLGAALELLLGPATELVVASCPINSTFQHTLQSEKWFIVVA